MSSESFELVPDPTASVQASAEATVSPGRADAAPAAEDVPPPPPVVSAEDEERSQALGHVVDDLAPQLDAVAWANAKFVQGADGDPLTAQLVDAGWDPELASDVVEQARVQTRGLRGVVTRADVAREEAARHGHATGLRWFAGWPALASAWRLLTTLSHLLRSRLRRRR